jgi:UDPglucose 6-dehydrogenase
MNDTKVCVIGIWHLGSVYSNCLADLGYRVVGADFDATRIKNLNAGTPPIFEPGLDELLKKNLNSGRLSYTTDIEQAVKDAVYVLVTFDTPVDDNDEVDLTPVFDACKIAAKYLKDGTVVIISSQVPVGTCFDKLNRWESLILPIVQKISGWERRLIILRSRIGLLSARIVI